MKFDFKNVKENDVYYKAKVVDDEGNVVDNDFERYWDLKEANKKAIKQIDEDYDDFSGLWLRIYEYKRINSKGIVTNRVFENRFGTLHIIWEQGMEKNNSIKKGE